MKFIIERLHRRSNRFILATMVFEAFHFLRSDGLDPSDLKVRSQVEVRQREATLVTRLAMNL